MKALQMGSFFLTLLNELQQFHLLQRQNVLSRCQCERSSHCRGVLIGWVCKSALLPPDLRDLVLLLL